MMGIWEEKVFLLHVHILAMGEFDIIPWVNVWGHVVREGKNIEDNEIW